MAFLIMESSEKNLTEIPAEPLKDRRKSELLRKSLHFLIALVPLLAAINRLYTIILLAVGTLCYTVMEYLRQKGINFPLVVPYGEVFVLGDSRRSAQDSRIYDTVPIDDILGSVVSVVRRRNL